MKIFKHLFCEHEYKYYETVEYYPSMLSLYPKYKFKFICTKCHKIIGIREEDVDQVFFEYRTDFKKAAACGDIVDVLPSYFEIPKYALGLCNYVSEYSGPAATKTLEYYKKKGIDLLQISR